MPQQVEGLTCDFCSICVLAHRITALFRSSIHKEEKSPQQTTEARQRPDDTLKVQKISSSWHKCSNNSTHSSDGLSDTPTSVGSSRISSLSCSSFGSHTSGWVADDRVDSFDEVSLQNIVGQGSFGKVYYATWATLPVAVKIMRWDKSTRKGRGNPVTEAELSLQLVHPNLTRTFKYYSKTLDEEALRELGFKNSSLMVEAWTVQEWCDRGTLWNFCNVPRYGAQFKDEVKEIFADIVTGGAYLHSHNVIHGDLSSNNVLLKTDASPKGFSCKICDFGLARILKSESRDIQTTQMGTVSFMPPELFEVDRCDIKLSPAADVYSSGILLWQVLTGSAPFSGCSPPQIVLRVATGRKLKLPDTAPQEFVHIFNQCTCMEPGERPHFSDLVTQVTNDQSNLQPFGFGSLDV